MKRLISSTSIAERNKKIYQAHLRGTPSKTLAIEFDLTVASINGIVAKQKICSTQKPRKMKLGKDYIRYKIRGDGVW